MMSGLMQQRQQNVGNGLVSEPSNDGKMVNLLSSIDKSSCYARNESSRFPMTNLFIGDTRLGCKSDADEQLILHVSFNEAVKVHSIKLTEFNKGLEPEQHPTAVKLYVNRTNMGFEDIEDIDPTQTLELTAEDLKESADPLMIKYVKFQRVRSITFFVEDNAGGDVTALGGLQFFGTTVANLNVKDLKKQG